MLVYGKNVAKEYLKTNKVRKVFLSNSFKDQEILSMINNSVEIEYLDKKRLSKYPKVNQGIILDVIDFEYSQLDTNASFLVMLDHIEDPHNFGAIIRSSEAAKVDGIIIPKDRSVVVNETVIKTSTGAISRVKIVQVANLVNAINKLKDNGYFVYAAEAGGEDYRTVDYADKVVLVIGSEGFGVSRLVKENSDVIISIPMKGEVNSLNASVAAAILIYGIGE